MRARLAIALRKSRRRASAWAGRAASALRRSAPAAPIGFAPPRSEPAADGVRAAREGEFLAQDTFALVVELGALSEFSEIMRRHLDSVCSQTAGASTEILGLATTIEGQVHDLVSYVGRAANSPDFVSATGQANAAVATGVSLIGQLGEQRSNRHRELEQEVEAVQALSAEMVNALEGVERMRMHTDVLAINVSIAASRSGEAGVGLEPLAREIRRLAHQTGELTGSIRRYASDIDARLSGSLTRRLERHAAEDEESSAHLATSFHHVSNSMAQVVSLQQAMIDRAHRDSAGLADPLMALCGSVQFQDVTRQQIDQVGCSLDTVTRHIVDLARAAEAGGTPPASSIRQCLAAASDSYVMDRQREAHDEAATPQLAAIELF